MTCKLEFHEHALKEWHKLDGGVKGVFKEKLAERLKNPQVPKDVFHTRYGPRYKIKHKSYRLIYAVDETAKAVRVLAVGKRERGQAYTAAEERR